MHKVNFILNGLLDLFFPNACEICGNALNHTEKYICFPCKYNLPYVNRHPKHVESLQKIFWGRIDIEKVYSVLNYQKGNHTQKILHAIKYKNKTKLGRHMGKIMGNQLKKAEKFDCIIPIPLHPKKQRIRGFNQSLILAEGIAETLPIPIITNQIERVKINKSQTQFSKYDRWDNVKQIFLLKNPSLLRNKHVLIVDDVLTTGATIESCAAEIYAKTACKISVATLAARV
ncbi:ComF family protein [Putridiphycobacter roseus]|uniref:ComF family protein n=1 Tax=Putridiphycobacter roseus TaxID=2219161 RepID=A0A2W1MXX3_9FLAO|nr:phosphoribosyltransferase family protein [Putridiphycobacter roseus]PZE16677.1 ComF family protein [Putridiphycobacter roseus]